MSLFVQHLLLLPTLLIASALTLWLRAWKVTTLLAGVALGVGLGVTFGGASVVLLTWATASFFLVAALNVILVAAGPPDASSRQEKTS